MLDDLPLLWRSSLGCRAQTAVISALCGGRPVSTPEDPWEKGTHDKNSSLLPASSSSLLQSAARLGQNQRPVLCPNQSNSKALSHLPSVW